MKVSFQHLLLSMLFAFLLGLTASPAHAALSTTGRMAERQNASMAEAPANKLSKAKKLGLFQRIKKFRASQFEKLRALQRESEKASTLSKAALFLFFGSIALRYLVGAVSVYTPAIASIISIAFLASIVLSLIVLFSDENRKSKAIAKTILIITAVAIIITLLIVAILLVVFLGV